jgi:hypothetical protein
MKNFFVKSWDWFSGKKTVIGTTCLIIAQHLPNDSTEALVLSIIGQVFGGVGIFHKAQKNQNIVDKVKGNGSETLFRSIIKRILR